VLRVDCLATPGANINDAKLIHSQNIGYVFAYLFPRDDAWQWFCHHTAESCELSYRSVNCLN